MIDNDTLCKINQIEVKTNETHDKVIVMETQVTEIYKLLMGNGRKGLYEEWTILKGNIDVWKFIASGGILSSVIALVVALI